MQELKIHVERCVRPLPASNDRKQRMRQELLLHLQTIYDEEYAASQDEAAAIARAIDRFGNAEEISAQLEQSIPRIGRIVYLLDRLMGIRPDETLIRRALRHAILMFSFFALQAILVGVVAILRDRLAGLPMIEFAFVSMAAGMAVLAFVSTFLLHGIRAAQTRFGYGPRFWMRTIPCGLLCFAMVFAFGTGLQLQFAAYDTVMQKMWVLLTTATISPLVLDLVAHLSGRELRAIEEWECLDLAE